MSDTYVLDGSPEDLERLLGIAALQEPLTRDALAATDLTAGWRVLDCGCGPVGALPELAAAVGPTGSVVGVERDAPTAERARAVVAHLGLTNVRVVTGDLDDPHTPIEGTFDLAHSRCFLMHQPDARATLAGVAQRLRPGGWLIVQEPLLDPPPRAHPHLAALTSYWDLMHEASARLGVPRDTVPDLVEGARAAGLTVQACGVVALAVTPSAVIHLHAATLEAARGRIVATGAGTSAEVDAVAAALQEAAAAGQRAWATTPFFLTLACRREDASGAADSSSSGGSAS